MFAQKVRSLDPEKAVTQYALDRWGIEEGLPVKTVTALLQTRDGYLWAGTQEGLARFDGLGSDIIHALFQDREGSLWIGAESGGLERLWNGKFTPYTTKEGFPADAAYAVYEAADGSIWAGSQGGGVTRLRDGTFRAFTTADGLPHDYVFSLAGDAGENLWIGTAKGLVHYRAGAFTTFTTADGLPANAVYALSSDSQDNLWIGTTGGLVRYRDGAFTTFTTADGLSSNDITVILEGRNGALWVGTYDGGLNLMIDGKVAARYTTTDGLLSNYVLTLYEDADGVLWFGLREGGLYRLENGRLTRYTTVEGLFNDTIQQILEDDAGNLWMTTNLGLFYVAREELDAFARGEVEQITSVAFDRSDGLKSREFMGGFQPAGWKGRDGRLWFPSNAGIVAVDPARLAINDVPPPIVIEQVAMDGKPLPPGGEMRIRPGRHRFEFHYAGLSLIASKKVRYAYRLAGEDEDWVEAGTRRTAYYSNLSPGEYRFYVRAVNADGVWSTGAATVSFYLEPFFYQTLWFWMLSPLTLLLIGFTGYRLRIDRLKAREQELERVVAERTRDLQLEKEKTETALRETERARAVIEEQAERLRAMDRIKTRFFSNISHEFRTPLTLNIGPLENALTGRYGSLSETLRRQMEIMLRNSRRLLRLINQLLDLSKLESGRMELKVQPANVVDFIEGIMRSFTAFTEKRGIDLQFETEKEETTLYFDHQNLEKVFFNLLSNAVKFTPDGGRIEVGIEEGPAEIGENVCEAVRITVRDSGPGIPQGERPYIFDRFHQVDGAVHRIQEGTGIGLSLVKELVELHGGVIEVESEPGAGAVFTVTLPKGTAHFKNARVFGEAVPGDGHPARGPMVEVAVLDEDEALHADVSADVTPDEGDDRPTLLIIDDNPDIRAYVAGCLREHYALYMGRDGRDGLEKARRHRPSLIISDVMMPVMNGYELCRAVKSDEAINHIPVILLTSKASVEDKIIGLEAGADDYIAKPFSARELLARVHNLLRLREQQSALKKLNKELVRINGVLREASEMKSQLLSIASHDMKNPLTAIREFANVIKEELDPESHLIELLDLVYDSTDQMLRLITQLLDSAALESGKLELVQEPVSLAELARTVVRRNERQAEKKDQRIVCTPASEHGLLVKADAERILETMDNLISNAIKYSPHGKNIYVTVSRVDGEVRFAVRDEGPGLTGEDKRKLFGKFQKLSAQPTGGESSSGLGLSIVKQVVEMHGGRVWAESEPGRGSTFTLALPALQAAVREDHPPRPQSRPGPPPQARRPA
ncbi:ATP-binding protein [Rhodocaloribacter sp.]